MNEAQKSTVIKVRCCHCGGEYRGTFADVSATCYGCARVGHTLVGSGRGPCKKCTPREQVRH